MITVAAVGAVALMLRGDVKQTASILRRNVRTVREWLEAESAAAQK